MDLTFNITPRPPLRVNPQVLTIIGQPKIRKTLTCSKIPDSYMIVLDPGGADFISAPAFDFDRECSGTSREKLKFFEHELLPQLKKKRPAKHVVFDHIGILVDWIHDDLNARKGSLLVQGGKDKAGYQMDSVCEQRYGAGEAMIDLKLRALWPQLLQCAEDIVLICHEAKSFDPADPEGKKKQIYTDIDLPGKVKKTPCELGSAVCKLVQKFPDRLTDELWGNFHGGLETAGGTRILRLDKRSLRLSVCKFAPGLKDPAGNVLAKIGPPPLNEPVVESFTTFWEDIYI